MEQTTKKDRRSVFWKKLAKLITPMDFQAAITRQKLLTSVSSTATQKGPSIEIEKRKKVEFRQKRITHIKDTNRIRI